MGSSVTKPSKEKLHRIDGKATLPGGRLTLWDLIKLWLSSLTLIQGSFNYAYFQGTGYSQTIYPWLKRIFGSNKDKLKKHLIDNMEFYNTGPAMGHNIIATMHIVLLQNNATEEQIRRTKFALMGPLAGINDALFNFGSQPLFAGIAAGISSNGDWTGFWFYMLVYNLFQFALGLATTILTYRSGEKFVKNISSVMSSMIKIASMVGITIIGALAVTYTSIKLDLHTITTIAPNGILAIKDTSYQGILDKMVPYLLPALLVGFSYIVMSKYGWSMYKLLMFLLLLGVSGFVYGVLA